MSRVLPATVEGKGHELQGPIEALQGFIRTAVATGLAVLCGSSKGYSSGCERWATHFSGGFLRYWVTVTGARP